MIIRARNIFYKKETKELTVNETGFNEINGCKNLRIKKLTCFCPFCSKEYYEENELLTHISKTHPEYFKFIEYEKIFIPSLGGKQITKLYITDDHKVAIEFEE